MRLTWSRAAVPCTLSVLSVALYWPVLGYGLWFDDYMDLRPYGWSEVQRILTGAWSVEGWQDAYHRPLATLHALVTFEVFGLNPRALHALSLVGLAVIVPLLFSAIRRLLDSRTASMVTLIYVVHPVLPNSTMAWIGNQKHIVAVLTVVAALRVWARCRESADWRAWRPVALWATVGFYFKEDTIMVLPALLTLQWLRARLIGDVPTPSRALLLAGAGWLAVLLTFRLAVFPEAGDASRAFSGEIPWRELFQNAVYTPARALLVVRYQGDLMPLATTFAGLLLAAGAWATRQAPGSVAGQLWLMGVVLSVFFALPLALVADMTTMRAHLLVLAAALTWTGGVMALFDRVGTRPLAAVVVVLVVTGGILRLAYISHRQLDERFGPCGWETQQYDQDVSVWPPHVIQADTKRWLTRKRVACDAGRHPYLWDELDVVRWRTDTGLVALVADRVHQARLVVHAGDQPVDISGPDGVIGRVPAGQFQTFDVTLRTTWRSRLRDAHRIDVRGSTSASLDVRVLSEGR